MNCVYTLFLALAAGGCTRENTESRNVQIADSANLVSTHKELESVIREYYVSIEKDVRMDLGVSEAEVIERVQSLINDGYVKKPAILIIAQDGVKWVTVDYPTYKSYMADHAVTLRKFHGMQPNPLDSSSVDSLRHNLMEALRERR